VPLIQILSLFGALAVLAAYAANQFGWVSTTTLAYPLVNAIGAGILTAVALLEDQWGFLLLEVVWTLVSLAALAQFLRVRPTRT
jgi:hypothetical protein